MLNFVVSIVALLLVVATPIVFGFFVFRVRGLAFNLQEVLWGVIASFFIQTILFERIVYFAVSIGILNNPLTQQIVYAAAGATCFYLCFFVLHRVAFRGRLSEGRVSRAAFGAIVIKTASDNLAAAWSNVNVAWRAMEGSLSEFLEQNVTNTGIDVSALEKLYRAYGPSQYAHVAIMTIMMALAVYLLFLQAAENKPLFIRLAYVLMFSFLYYYTLAIPVPFMLSITAVVFCLVQLLGIKEVLATQWIEAQKREEAS